MTAESEFFDKLNDELSKTINALAEKQDLEDTEAKIKEIFEGWNVKRNQSRTSVSAFVPDQMVQNLCSIVMSFVLLYRQRHFDGFGRGPRSFMIDFFKRIIPTSLFPDKTDFDDKFSGMFSKVELESWLHIQSPLRPQITISLWGNLYGLESKASLEDSVKKISNKESGFRIHSEPESGTYEEYISIINEKLKFGVTQQDLILMDSILLAEYKSKGVFDTVYYYLKDKLDKLAEDLKLPELEVAMTDNGYIEAIPITRNFHVPGRGKDFIATNDIDILNKGINFSDIAVLSENKKRKWESLRSKDDPKLLFSNPGRDYPHSTLNSQDNPIHSLEQFITYMGRGVPFVPMQAARGAHVVYTLFAYLSKPGTSMQSFIELDRKSRKEEGKICIRMLLPELVQDRIELFLQFVYSFVPMISLCLDHELAAALRIDENFKHIWFDPCLPIEAQKFQKETIKFGKEPLKIKEDNASLSCLGGYCLALNQKADAKHQVAQIGVDLAEDYFKEANKIVANNQKDPNEWPKDYNCRIKYTKDATVDKSYLKTPEYIAKRPNFYGWKAIEELISDIVRPYMVTVMLLRAITDETTRLTITYNGNEKQREYLEKLFRESNDKYIPESGLLDVIIKQYNTRKDKQKAIVDEESIELHLLSAKNIITKCLNESSGKDHAERIDSNLDCLIEDRNSMLGLLRSGIDKVEQPIDIPGKVIKYLSNRMSQTLFTKVKTLSHSSGWEFRDMHE